MTKRERRYKRRPHTRSKRSISERFWDKVAKRGPDECWPWCASKKAAGYGQFVTFENGKMRNHGAHRVALELHLGEPIPAGKIVMHTCDNPECVNPAHLRIGTVQDNVDDMRAKGRDAYAFSYPFSLMEDMSPEMRLYRAILGYPMTRLGIRHACKLILTQS